jgi:hypothetical protein
MELEGRLNPALSLPEVLQFLSMGKMTGVLTVVSGVNTVTLSVRQGKLVNSSSLTRSRRLGQLLVNRGAVTRTRLEDALEHQRRQKPQPLLGQVLLDRGMVSPDQLKQAIRLQMEEEMWDLFSLAEGSFKFEHGTENTIGEVLVELDIEPLILEGTRRMDEWMRIVKNIPNELAVPCIKPLADVADRETLACTEAEWRVLSLVNGYYNAGSLALRSGVGKFETFRILNSFLASGHIMMRLEQVAGPALDIADSLPAADSGDNGSHSERTASLANHQAGSSSARLIALFRKKLSSSPPAPAPPPPPQDEPVIAPLSAEPRPPLSFVSPVGFVASLANDFVGHLAASNDFRVGPGDDRLAEYYWRAVVMANPRADLVTATGNEVDALHFERFVEFCGVNGPIRPIYDDTIDSLGRLLRVIHQLAGQRLSVRLATRLFTDLAADHRQRATIGNSEDFYFQDFAEKVVS